MLNFNLDADINSLPFLLYMEEQEQLQKEAAAKQQEMLLRQQEDFASEDGIFEDDEDSLNW